jgi:hypothetical protein
MRKGNSTTLSKTSGPDVQAVQSVTFQIYSWFQLIECRSDRYMNMMKHSDSCLYLNVSFWPWPVLCSFKKDIFSEKSEVLYSR